MYHLQFIEIFFYLQRFLLQVQTKLLEYFQKSKFAASKCFDENFLIKLTIKQVTNLHCAPVKLIDFNSKHDQKLIYFCTLNKSESRAFYFKSVVFFIAYFFEMAQILKALIVLSGSIYQSRNSMFDLQILIQFSICVIYIHSCQNKSNTLVNYWNSLFKFKQKYSRVFSDLTWRHLSTIECMNLLFVPSILVCSAVFGPCFILGFHWTNPCKPTLIGYFLMEQCYESVKYEIRSIQFLFNFVVKLLVFVSNIWVWCFGVNGASFIFITVHIVAPVITHDCIELFWKRLKTSNDIYNDARLYRQLQIFNVLYNFVQERCLDAFIFSTMFLISICFSLLVSYHNKINIAMLVTFLNVLVNSTVAVVLFLGCMLSAPIESKEKLAYIRRLDLTHTSTAVRKWTRRFWRSCGPIKIKFGGNNFLEKLTPLRCLDYAINLTVQFLLLSVN